MLKSIERTTQYDLQKLIKQHQIKRDQIVQITETKERYTLWYWED
jgi:hypothetical protein